MTQHLTLTLAAWQDWIWLVIVGATIVGSAIGNMKKKSQAQRKRDEGHNPEQLEQMAARRREQLREASRGRMQTSAGGGDASAGGGDPTNLTMAERIARARAKAQYEQRSERSTQPAPQEPNEAQRRALAQREAELQRRREAARAQQQAQERARQQAQAQQRARQQAQQRARQQQAHTRARQQARQRGVLVHEHVVVPDPSESTTRRTVPTRKPRRASTQPVQLQPMPFSGSAITGNLSRDDLRKAIVLNEVLGKPVSLREGEGSTGY